MRDSLGPLRFSAGISGLAHSLHDVQRMMFNERSSTPFRDDRTSRPSDVLERPQPMKRVTLVLTLALAAGLSAPAAQAQTLKTIKDRGMLSCGVSQGLPGFSSPDDKGNWTGLDV